jgi:ABC-2 type transport system permease protein
MITTVYALSVLAMVILPVILAVLFRQRYRVYWILFIVGCVTFLGAQAVHLPLNELLVNLGILADNPQESEIPVWQSALILGLTAGLCEELARTIGYAVVKWARRFEDGVMLGLGHGGIEAMIFGGVLTAATVSSLLSLQGVDLESLSLTAAQLEAVTTQMERFGSSPIFAFAPLMERTFAIGAHVLFSLMVLQAFIRKKPLFILLAIALHALVDAVAVYVAISTELIWATWAAFLIILIPGWIWLARLWQERNKEISELNEDLPHSGPITREIGLFLVSLRKEFLFLWRTWRVLILCAVLLAFSIMSPLMVKFTPQMLSAIEGAEMFADLIPEMTIADAIAQHIETISQFGFIIVILMGMGIVAVEKEMGTAAMVLSKPLSRGGFLNSKFAAQVVLYFLAFTLALAGGYYYTTILFGHIDFMLYVGINLLLLIWVLVFVAVTLLGSTLGNSSASAAGFALGGSILFLIAGTIPRYGPLLPGGLLAWAGQIGAQVDVAPNWGAVTMSFVIILLCLIAALGVFERQEL